MIKRITEHDHAIVQVRTPVPYPFSFVNSYLIAGRNGYTLIDPGINTEQARQSWYETTKELNIAFTDIEKIVLTHHHPDHYGLAGWIQQKCGAPVYMSEDAFAQAMRMWGEDATINEELTAFFIEHGMDEETAQSMIPHFESFAEQVSPHADVTTLSLNDTIFLGDREYELIQADGHATGQLCFYHRYNEHIFCGDQVVQGMTPNVNYMPGGDVDPLASFIASLEELSQLDIKKAFPGHRQPLDNFAERALDIIEHHRERLQKMLDHLIEPLTAYELCRLMFGYRLTTHQLRFAMTETLAHLVYMERAGQIQTQRHSVKGTVVYLRSPH